METGKHAHESRRLARKVAPWLAQSFVRSLARVERRHGASRAHYDRAHTSGARGELSEREPVRSLAQRL